MKSERSTFKEAPGNLNMTTLTLSSGEILDIISALNKQETTADFHEDYLLAGYYSHLASQFQNLHQQLQTRPGERRQANLVLIDCPTDA
jgi:hypothetical protein